jgi:outer membrane protein
MKLKFVCSLPAMAVLVAATGLAQTSNAAPAQLPSSPGSAPDPPSIASGGGGAKIGTININSAILYSNEGQRDFQAMQKNFEPKQNQLKAQNDEIDQLKKQLNTQGGTMNDDAKANLQRQIEQKQKTLERGQQDFQEEVTNQENEIAQRILQKMAPVVQKYAQDNHFELIIDTSNQWPQGPVLWQSGQIDITKQVVDTYNAQSGVAAPAARTNSPSGTRPAGTGAPRTGTGNAPTTKPAGTSGGTTQPPK